MSGRRKESVGATLAAVAALLGCVGRPAPRDVPALLASPTAAARAELADAVSRALSGRPVTLAEDALTKDDTLLVERTTRRDASGAPLDGRRTDRPDRFHLVASGAECVLVHEGTGRRFVLKAASCTPR